MVLGFQKQFEPLILSGVKIHTIRQDKNGRWKKGAVIQMATGVRTKEYRQFNKDMIALKFVKNIQSIAIIFIEATRVAVKIRSAEGFVCLSIEIQRGDVLHEKHPILLLSKNDGFGANYWDFLNFFLNKYGKVFNGYILHWTDFLY